MNETPQDGTSHNKTPQDQTSHNQDGTSEQATRTMTGRRVLLTAAAVLAATLLGTGSRSRDPPQRRPIGCPPCRTRHLTRPLDATRNAAEARARATRGTALVWRPHEERCSSGPSPSGSRFPRSASTRPWRTGEQVMETPDAADKAGWFAPGPTPRARACRHRRSCHLERPVGRDLRHPLRGLDRGPDFDNVLGTVVRAVTQLSSHRPCAPASPIHDPRTHLGDGSVDPTPGRADTREAQDVPLAGGIGLSDIQRFPAALRRSAHRCPAAAARLSPCR